jgi:preprotein translocase subunit SecG
MNFIYYTLLTLFMVLSLFMILLVLIQKGRGGGLSSAFGGVGGNTAFGAKTGDVLTWATSIVFGVFLILAIGLNLLADQLHEEALDPLNRNAATTQAAAPGVLDDLSNIPEAPSSPPAMTPTTQSTEPVMPATMHSSTQPVK